MADKQIERVKETGTSRRIIEENKVEKSLDTVHNRVNLNYNIFKDTDRKNKILKKMYISVNGR